MINNVQFNMITQNSSLHNLLTGFQDITHKYIAKSVLMVAPHAIIFLAHQWGAYTILLASSVVCLLCPP